MPLTTSTKTSDLDLDFLDLALALVVKGEDQVKPNPLVSAVIVRDGIIVD
jgi:pyrimidine deaminase RibD-like protein